MGRRKKIGPLNDDQHDLGCSCKQCHQKALWHQSVSVLLITEWGDVVLVKETVHKQIQPERWTMPEQHVVANLTNTQNVEKLLSEKLSII